MAKLSEIAEGVGAGGQGLVDAEIDHVSGIAQADARALVFA